MKINKNKAMEIAKGNNEYEVAFVGNLEECHDYIESIEGKLPLFTKANIYRVDEVQFNGDTWGKNDVCYTDEKGNYWYYVLKINGKLYQ